MYAQWKVFKLAKESGVTVSLDGQGADELLAGYPYFKLVLWAELLQKFKIFKYLKETSLSSSSPLDYLLNPIMAMAGFLSHRKMIAFAGMREPQYRSRWINNDFFRNTALSRVPIKKVFSSRLNQRLYEVFSYDGLPALLRYADRNSMSHSLEARMPFLDYRFVTYVFSLPSQDKVSNGLSKYIMRQALNNDIPSQILMRQDKVGFETPEARWFRGELLEWSRDIIHSNLMAQRGFYDIQVLRKMWKNHQEGKINVSRPLWRAINLELWHRKYFD
jgi:asparagine synthase (glutamine-hydrolysing)